MPAQMRDSLASFASAVSERQSPDRIRLAEQLIGRSDLALYVLSQRSLHSMDQGSEARAAARLDKTIVVVVMGDVSEADLPSEFKTYRMLRVGDADNMDGLLSDLSDVQSSLRERSTDAVTANVPTKVPRAPTRTEQ